ncbi:hypothetical protein BJ741DRAFT_438085 [Chytriomyces cf. hyalinus JEL632]|nr:hypothetical protein BJ741DRAFT_438085 [Chytriomyces cf. hyalinus JEL632]
MRPSHCLKGNINKEISSKSYPHQTPEDAQDHPMPKGQNSEREGEEEEEDGVIRCICGQNEDDGTTMVQCDGCQVWQHTACFGLGDDPAQLPDEYECELCSATHVQTSKVTIWTTQGEATDAQEAWDSWKR